MKKFILSSVVILILFLSSCDSDSDSENIVDTTSTLPNVTLIAEDDDLNVIQVDIKDDGENTVATNLTEQLGLPFSYSKISHKNDVLTFFDQGFSTGIFTIYEKHLYKGEVDILEDICTPSNAAIIASRHSNDKIVLFTFDGSASNIYIQDKVTNECIMVNFGNKMPNRFGNSLVDDEMIYLYQYNESNQLSVLRMSLNTGDILNELILENLARVRMINDLLYVKYSNGTLRIYDKVTFELLNELQIDNLGSWDEWISQIENNGNNIIVNYSLPAPGFFPTSPAIFDISTFEIKKGGPQLMFDIRDNLIDEINIDASILEIDLDVYSESVVLAYRDSSNNYNLLFSNFDAEILKIVPLSIKPKEIFIH